MDPVGVLKSDSPKGERAGSRAARGQDARATAGETPALRQSRGLLSDALAALSQLVLDL